MDAKETLEVQWPYLLSYLAPGLDLDASSRDCGALIRRREIASADQLLRLALVYGFCGLSLRQTGAWAEVLGVGRLSDVAVLKRLRKAAPWLGQLLGAQLAHRTRATFPAGLGMRLRLVDATTVSIPGSRGTDWRVHLGFDLRRLAIDSAELTDSRGGETLARFKVRPQELLVGDRGYAHRAGMAAVREAGGHFLIRLNWQNVPLQNRQGGSFDLLAALRGLGEAQAEEFAVQTAPDPEGALPAIATRLVAVRKSEAASTQDRLRIRRNHAKKQKNADLRTLEAAAFTFVLTSLPDGLLTPQQLLEIYRFRWQIELAFKRLKSLLYLDQVPAKDPNLGRSFLYAKLLAALLLDDLTDRFLAFSPWGYPLHSSPAKPLADPTGLS